MEMIEIEDGSDDEMSPHFGSPAKKRGRGRPPTTFGYEAKKNKEEAKFWKKKGR